METSVGWGFSMVAPPRTNISASKLCGIACPRVMGHFMSLLLSSSVKAFKTCPHSRRKPEFNPQWEPYQGVWGSHSVLSPSLPYWGWKPPELSLLQQHILLSWIPVSIKVDLALKRRGRCWFGISHEQWVSSCAWGNRSNKKKPLKLHLDSTLTSIKMIYYLGNNCI